MGDVVGASPWWGDCGVRRERGRSRRALSSNTAAHTGKNSSRRIDLSSVFVRTFFIIAWASLCARPCTGAQELAYASLRWEQTGPTTVMFFLESAWTAPEDPTTDAVMCQSCKNPAAPAVGDLMRLRSPSEQLPGTVYKHRFLYGDETSSAAAAGFGSGIGVVNGTNGMNLTSNVTDGLGVFLMKLYAEFEHNYSSPGTYTASLQGCCRGVSASGANLRNNKGAGWDIASRVIVQSGWTPTARSNDYTLASPFVPMISRTRAVRNAALSMKVRAFDLFGRSRTPQTCVAGGSSAGCRFTYRLAAQAGAGGGEGGYNYTSSLSQWSALPASITIDKNTGLVTIPASASSSFATTGLYYNLVVLAYAGDWAAANSATLPYTTVDFSVVFYDNALPTLAAQTLNQSYPANSSLRNAWPPNTQDVSTGIYFDFVCLYQSTYEFLLSSSSVPIYMINITSREPFRTYPPQFQQDIVTIEGRPYIRVTWKPICASVGVQPICWQACTGGAPGPGAVCSPIECVRLEVKGDCLMGNAAFIGNTPAGGNSMSNVLIATVGRLFTFSLSATGILNQSALQFINISTVLDGNDTRINKPNDKAISVLNDPGMPNGMTITNNAYVGTGQTTSRVVTWTPLPGQEGLLYTVCFLAQSKSQPDYCLPERRCIRIRTELGQPDLVGDSQIVASPRFDENRTVSDGAELAIAAGCKVVVKYLISRGPYDAILVPEPTVGIPPGAEISRTVMSTAGVNGTVEDTWELTWRPTRDFLKDSYPACVRVSDALYRENITTREAPYKDRCVVFKMIRCRYCAAPGQSLYNVAAYWWGADWVQIWGANAHVRNPDKLQDNELLTLGPSYTVKTGDTLARLADRFQMTKTRLQMLNPEASAENLSPGLSLCIMPEVCPENKHTILSAHSVGHA